MNKPTKNSVFKLSPLWAVLLSSITLIGCSGSGSSDGKNSIQIDDAKVSVDVERTQLNGQLVDPYIANATVCADLNKDGQCGANEPRVTSDAEGRFSLGEWPKIDGTPLDSIRILTLNQGTWQQPDYGSHQGKPYGLPLSVDIKREAQVEVEKGQESTAQAPVVMATPATSLQTVYGFSEEELLGLLNQHKDLLGKTFEASDLLVDPLKEFGNEPVEGIADAKLAVFRAYLSLYALNRVMAAMHTTIPSAPERFKNDLLIEGTTINNTFTGIVEGVVAGNNAQAYAPSTALIKEGEQLMRQSIAQSAGSFASYAQAAIKDFPPITVAVAIGTSVAIIEYEMDQVQGWLKEKITEVTNAHTTPPTEAQLYQDFETVANYVLTNFNEDLTPERIALFSAELGTNIYGSVNKQHFEDYKSVSLPSPGENLGQQVYDGIMQASPALKAGIQARGESFFLKKTGADTFQSISTSALPVNAMAAIKAYVAENGVTQESLENLENIDPNVWSQFAVGSLQVSGLPESETCSVSGTVYKEDNKVAVGVPLYLAYGPSKEMHVVTDAEGKFEFTRLPIQAKAAEFWGDEKIGKDHYFIGAIAGKRRPVPAYVDYEANADSYFDCVSGNKSFTVNPTLRPVVVGTKIQGNVSNFIHTGSGKSSPEFTAEVHAKVETPPAGVNDGGWIMESFGTSGTGPFSTFENNGSFSITELAGGEYKLRMIFYPSDGAVEMVECDTPYFTVGSGTTINTFIELSSTEPTSGDFEKCGNNNLWVSVMF